MENMAGEFQQSFVGKTSLFLIFIHLLVIIMCIVIKQKNWIWINGIPSGYFQLTEHPHFLKSLRFLSETKKVSFKNEKTKKLKMVPFGETPMFFKSGSTEYKSTQEDLITPLFSKSKVIANQPSYKLRA